MDKIEKQKAKYAKNQPKIVRYKDGEKILIKNRELRSTMEGIAKKLLLLYTGPVSYTHLDVYKRQKVYFQ